MTSTSDEVGHTAFDLETIGYYVGNPSAWEEGFDQRISDQIGKAVEEIQRLRNSHDSLVKALEKTTDWIVALAASGDAGFWDGEKVEEVIEARAALSQAKGGK